MSLDARNAPKSGGAPRELIPAGAHYARLVGITDLGIQARSFAGQAKEPCQAINLTFEFPYSLITIEENGQQVQKPRWLSMDVNVVEGDNAKFPKIMAAFGGDPVMTNWLGKAMNIQVDHKAGTGDYVGRTFERISNVSALPHGADAQVLPLVSPTRIFNFDAPDATVFNDLPDFLQNKIRQALNFDTIAARLAPAPGQQPVQAAPAPAPQPMPAPAPVVPPAAPTLPAATAQQPAVAMDTPPAPMPMPAAPAAPAPVPAPIQQPAPAPVAQAAQPAAMPTPQPAPAASAPAAPQAAPPAPPAPVGLPALTTDTTPF